MPILLALGGPRSSRPGFVFACFVNGGTLSYILLLNIIWYMVRRWHYIAWSY